MRRIAITACCLFVLIWVGYVEFLNYMAWDTARFFGRQSQVAWALSTPLPDLGLATLAGPRIDRFGLSFQVHSPLQEGARQWKTADVQRFTGGGMLIFYPLEVDNAKLWRGNGTAREEAVAELIGHETLRSNYDIMAVAVQETPECAKLWASRKHNLRCMMLLMTKTNSIDSKAKSIHPINGGVVRGFQFGDPSVEPYMVSFALFDQKDRQYQLVISGKGMTHPIIIQPQINALVASTVSAP
jgi:hypothetical protein